MIVPSKLKDTLKASKKASKKAHEVMFFDKYGYLYYESVFNTLYIERKYKC